MDNRQVEIYFQHMKNRPPFDDEGKRKELLDRLNAIKGVNIPQDRISARPSFPLAVLLDTTERNKLIDAFNWYFKEALV